MFPVALYNLARDKPRQSELVAKFAGPRQLHRRRSTAWRIVHTCRISLHIKKIVDVNSLVEGNMSKILIEESAGRHS